MVGVSFSVIPMNPTLTSPTCLTQVGGNSVSPVASTVTLAARYWKLAPGNGCAGS